MSRGCMFCHDAGSEFTWCRVCGRGVGPAMSDHLLAESERLYRDLNQTPRRRFFARRRAFNAWLSKVGELQSHERVAAILRDEAVTDGGRLQGFA